MGGEKTLAEAEAAVKEGSPPHGRGKECFRLLSVRPKRITPAWAGKSHDLRTHELGSRDHPRMGGEKRKAKTSRLRRAGSPPHGRGKGGRWPEP